jgi:uncharacterized protein (DUF885 family)
MNSKPALGVVLSFMMSAAVFADESTRLNEFFEEVFQEQLDRDPMQQTRLGIKKDYGEWGDFSEEAKVRDLAIQVDALARMREEFDVDELDDQARLSYRLFEHEVESAIAGFQWRYHNYPVNQMFGFQSQLPAFLINFHRIADISDADAYISRVDKLGDVFDQFIHDIEVRAEKGILPPRFVFPLVLSDCRNVLKGVPFEDSKESSTLLSDFEKKLMEVEDLSADGKEVLIKRLNESLLSSVWPAYRKLIAVLEELEPTATEDAGAWKFPRGDAFYGHRLRQITTTDLSAAEIHELGLAEMARIHGEMRAIMKQVGFDGTLQEFFEFMKEDGQFYYPNTEEGRERYLAEATAIIDSFREDLDRMFITQPKADMIVKRVEPFREKSAGKAFYNRGTPDGSRPGVYYANLYEMKDMPTYQMEALAFHEGIPGHHMQLSIMQELEGIPKFRRFGGYTAYIEGWGLYCELLPKEFGYYQDPYSDFGRLAMELWRAARLVVDTGLHHHRWTRERAIDYLVENTPNPSGDCVKAINRYIVMPGQATAYKIGMLKILELRTQAKESLGEKFDLREFHDVVLANGAVPLDILEMLVAEWVAEKE